MINVGGLDWQAIQSNGWRANFDLIQDATGKLRGNAKAGHPVEIAFSGSVDQERSKVSGDSVLIVVNWDSGSRGVYSGNLNLERQLVGISFDEANPGSQATWFSSRTF
jgi:hypothetical protein